MELANRLTKDGISCIFDQYLDNGTPKEGWALWSEKNILEADYVLIICTEGYYRRVRGDVKEETGRGTIWEFELILKLIYKDDSQALRFIPVLVIKDDKKYIPERLSDLYYYCLDMETEYNKLLGRITKKPVYKVELEPSPPPEDKKWRETKEKKEKKPDKPEHPEDKGKIETKEKENIKDVKIEVEREERKKEEEKREKKDEKEKIKSPKKPIKYLIIFAFAIIAVAIGAFIILNPFEIKDTGEKREPSKKIITRQIENMKGDFVDLKTFLSGKVIKKEKLEKCQEFLNKHQTVPDNDEKAAMVSETNIFITQLETEIGKDEQHQICLDAAKEYIKNGEYQKALNELEKAKKVKDTEEITALSTGIREKQIEIMRGEFETLKKFLAGGATKKAQKYSQQ